MRAALDAQLRQFGIMNAELTVIGSYKDLGALINRLRLNYFDLILCRMEAEGGEETHRRVVDVVKTLQGRSPLTQFALVSSRANIAMCAYETNVAFLGLPFDQSAFNSVIGRIVDDITESKARRFGVKSTKGTVSMNLADITFAETGKKGPLIHLPAEREVTTRGTLQALYDRLSGLDERFVRAGGSFIINLDNVRSVGESSVIFGDGETIILPTRARKPIRDAFLAYQLRS